MNHRELVTLGVKVSERTVRRLLVRMRADSAPTAKPPVPKVREVTTLVLTHPDALTEDDKTLAKELHRPSPRILLS